MSCNCPTCGQPLPETGIFFDDEAGILVVGGQFVFFTKAEYALFSALWNAPGRTRTKPQLMDGIYGLLVDEEPQQKIVDVYVCKIRRKLGDLPLNIETLWGNGYRIVVKTEAYA